MKKRGLKVLRITLDTLYNSWYLPILCSRRSWNADGPSGWSTRSGWRLSVRPRRPQGRRSRSSRKTPGRWKPSKVCYYDWPYDFFSSQTPYLFLCFASQMALLGFSVILSFILSRNKSPYGWGIPASQRERERERESAYSWRRRRKSPKNLFPMNGIQTHDLSLLSGALYPLDYGALPQESLELNLVSSFTTTSPFSTWE